MDLKLFTQWMQNHRTLAPSTIEKYTRAVRIVSKEMNEQDVITKSINDMSLIELDIAISHILRNPYFAQKNKTGNNMYSTALKQFRCYMLNLAEEDALLSLTQAAAEYASFPTTEKEIYLKARVGQGTYRQQLLHKYHSTCCVTGIDNPKLLVASHIKPWSVSNNTERLDVENGFLLSANMDKLFDSGLISFKNNGAIIISKLVGDANQNRLQISKDTVANLRGSSQLYHYLDYHRDVLFVK